MMKRILITAAVIAIAGCAALKHPSTDNPYEKPPFYTQWTNTGSPLDRQINADIAALRQNPHLAPVHNDLGQLLVQKGFPKDAENEFERAVDADPHFYQAWYNLGLIRASLDNHFGAERAFRRTVRLAKGHAEALFQLGLIEEEKHNNDKAIDYYAKALRHNPAILDVRVNPRVLDSSLMDLVLLRNYERDHARQTSRFLGTPAGYTAPAPPAAAQQPEPALSPQATPAQIVAPSNPVTEQGKQSSPPKTTT